MRLLKDVHAPYADRVSFVLVGIDPSEGPEVLRAYRASQGYPWPVTIGPRETLERYQIVSTSIKYAIDRQGIIRYRQGYGVEDAETWRRVFDELASR